MDRCEILQQRGRQMLVCLNAQWSLTKGKTYGFPQIYVQAGDSLYSKYPHNAELSGRLWSLERHVVGMKVNGISMKS